MGSGDAARFLDVLSAIAGGDIAGGSGEVAGSEGEESASESGTVRGGGIVECVVEMCG